MDTQSRKTPAQFRTITVGRDTHTKLSAIADKLGMTNIAVASRLVSWFVDLPQEEQLKLVVPAMKEGGQ